VHSLAKECGKQLFFKEALRKFGFSGSKISEVGEGGKKSGLLSNTVDSLCKKHRKEDVICLLDERKIH